MVQGAQPLGRKFLEQVTGTLVICWRRMLRAGAIAAVCGIVLTEIFASVSTRRVPPPAVAQLVALALAIGLAYSAAATVLAIEIFAAVLDTICYLEGDASAGARAAAALSGQDFGLLGGGLVGGGLVLGRNFLRAHRPAASPAARAPARPEGPQRMATASAGNGRAAASGVSARLESLRSADTQPAEQLPDTTTAPARSLPPQLPPLPVRADQLPRIEWANQPDPPRGMPRPPVAAAVSTRPLPQTPVAPIAPAPKPGAPELEPASTEATWNDAPLVEPLWHERSPELVPTLEDPTVVPTLSDDAPGTLPAPEGAASPAPGSTVSRATPRATRPLPPASGPFDGRPHSGGVWERLGQAVLGHAGLPAPTEPDDPPAGALPAAPPHRARQ